jgi:hypothetical protein
MEKPSPKALQDVAGISQPYASMILNGDRKPGRPLAIHLFRKLGWRHESIAGLSEDDMAALERIEPWAPREAQEAA